MDIWYRLSTPSNSFYHSAASAISMLSRQSLDDNAQSQALASPEVVMTPAEGSAIGNPPCLPYSNFNLILSRHLSFPLPSLSFSSDYLSVATTKLGHTHWANLPP